MQVLLDMNQEILIDENPGYGKIYTEIRRYKMNLGEKIQMLRNSAGLSQEELAEKIYVTRQSVSLWEQNKSQPSIDNVAMLCEVFKISADELLEIGGKSIPYEN